jgi:4a-hydroxytetrahydrobiopterin dehydratase
MWIEENNQLKCSFEFTNFIEAFGFMTKVALVSEKLNHHPDWRNVYNTIDIALYTGDAGNIITEKDRKLAKEIDKIFKGKNSIFQH